LYAYAIRRFDTFKKMISILPDAQALCAGCKLSMIDSNKYCVNARSLRVIE